MIKTELHMGLNKMNKQRNEPKRRHEKQRSTYLHTLESHKNTKMEAIIYAQRNHRVKRKRKNM